MQDGSDSSGLNFTVKIAMPLGVAMAADSPSTQAVEAASEEVCGLHISAGDFQSEIRWTAADIYSITDLKEFGLEKVISAYGPTYGLPLFEHRAVVFSVDAEVDADSYRSSLHEFNPGQEFGLTKTRAAAAEVVLEQLARTVNTVALGLCIARPTSAVCRFMYSFDEERFVRRRPCVRSAMDEAVAQSAEFGWPTIAELPLDEVWQWLHGIPRWDSGRPSTPAGRAIAALSRVQSTNESVPRLIWALCALEAIYCERGPGLAHQLMAKSQVVLGSITEFKNRFRAIYKNRSRLVHGDFDLPLEYTQAMEFSEEDSPTMALYESSGLAQALLLATLQDLVKEGRYGYEFTYKVV